MDCNERKGLLKCVRENVKVKLSLCLTKHHDTKTYPVRNSAPRCEDVRVSGGIAPSIKICIYAYLNRETQTACQ